MLNKPKQISSYQKKNLNDIKESQLHTDDKPKISIHRVNENDKANNLFIINEKRYKNPAFEFSRIVNVPSSDSINKDMKLQNPATANILPNPEYTSKNSYNNNPNSFRPSSLSRINLSEIDKNEDMVTNNNYRFNSGFSLSVIKKTIVTNNDVSSNNADNGFSELQS